ncbi:MAG: Alpha-L-glutamate ligase family protein [Candidatus Moranbacteria bacterium GW2011_GWA2_39_41]|nr:MAG: Alpha-L-glutamate ligase family protein [Candidatus Moranbacteria bacterium GW2011_GWA2_39_41]
MFEFFKNSRKLLGMNSRNLEFIRPFNRAKAKRLADNKMHSKRVLKKNGVSVSKLLATIKTLDDLENFDWQTLPNSFALKPNRGFGGEGIIVVYGKKKNRDDAWVKADRSLITIDDLKNHIRNILDGSFSLSNTPDFAFFEERLQLLKLFKPYSYKGIPDIRVIVFNKIPVMAMLRLPTKESGGKANLHQGAIGVGIDLATGVTTTAIQNNRLIEKIPGTQLSTSGLRIPYWKDILLLATRAQEISGLGYLGADIAIDKENGPTILELNARPGLAIQIANLAGLTERLKRVSGLKIKTVEKGVRVSMDLFGGEIEEEVEEISGRKVIGTVEKIQLLSKENEKEIEMEVKIDTGATSTSIDIELAKELGFVDVLEFFEKIDLPTNFTREQAQDILKKLKAQYQHPDLADIDIIYSSHGVSIRPKVNISFTMNGILINSNCNIVKREDLKFRMIVGKRDLRKFLIDVSK